MAADLSLTVSLDGIEINDLLGPFSWLFPKGASLVVMSYIGDLFVQGDADAIFWLDVGRGSMTRVANDRDSFWKLAPQQTDDWFAPQLVSALRTSGLSLGKHECYCYLRLPLLGGDYRPSNFVVRDVVTHVRTWGPVLKQIWDLPDGTKVRFKEVP